MARPGAGGLNVGRAAGLIVAGLLIAVFVLNKGDDVPSVASGKTNTSIDLSDITTPTTTRSATPTTLALRPKASFKTVAVNATNTGGVGAKATTRLTNDGYNALAPGDAAPTLKAATKATAVLHLAGFEREAAQVAALFGIPQTAVRLLTSPPPSTAVKDASIVVLIGPDLRL